jgi:hypothetical protein
MSCNDYRGISVAPVLAKLYAMVLEGRITKWAEANGVRARSQAGFRAKFRTTDHIFTLQTLIDKAKAHSTTLYCCFVDFKKRLIRCLGNFCGSDFVRLVSTALCWQRSNLCTRTYRPRLPHLRVSAPPSPATWE